MVLLQDTLLKRKFSYNDILRKWWYKKFRLHKIDSVSKNDEVNDILIFYNFKKSKINQMQEN